MGELLSREERARAAADEIRAAGDYRWVGIYEAREGRISVMAWSGPAPPTYPSFPATEGLCGAAVGSRQTVVVGDVDEDPRYLTTLATTRSEMVVPIVRAGTVLGVLDVESERPRAFSESDRRRLEGRAVELASIWD